MERRWGAAWRVGDGPDAYGFTAGVVTVEVAGGFDWVVTVEHDGETGRPEVSEVTVKRRGDGPCITARDLQAARFGAVRRFAVERLTFPSPTGGGLDILNREVLDISPSSERVRQLLGPSPESVRQLLGHDRGGALPGPERVKKAAAAYQGAAAGGRTRAVMAACDVKAGMARKLVSEARDKGLLPRARGERRGGV